MGRLPWASVGFGADPSEDMRTDDTYLLGINIKEEVFRGIPRGPAGRNRMKLREGKCSLNMRRSLLTESCTILCSNHLSKGRDGSPVCGTFHTRLMKALENAIWATAVLWCPSHSLDGLMGLFWLSPLRLCVQNTSCRELHLSTEPCQHRPWHWTIP